MSNCIIYGRAAYWN